MEGTAIRPRGDLYNRHLTSGAEEIGSYCLRTPTHTPLPSERRVSMRMEAYHSQ